MKVTLDSIRKSIEVKYAPFEIELDGGRSLILRQVLRLPETDRLRIIAAQDALDGEKNLDRQVEIATEMLKAAAGEDAEHLVDEVIALVGGDPAAVMELTTQWSQSSQVGEASPSPS